MLVPEAPPKSRSWRLTLIVGLVCVAVGVGLLGYVGWEYIGTNIVSKHRQAEITKGLKAQWESEGVKGSPAAEGVKDSVDVEQVERGEGRRFCTSSDSALTMRFRSSRGSTTTRSRPGWAGLQSPPRPGRRATSLLLDTG